MRICLVFGHSKSEAKWSNFKWILTEILVQVLTTVLLIYYLEIRKDLTTLPIHNSGRNQTFLCLILFFCVDLRLFFNMFYCKMLKYWDSKCIPFLDIFYYLCRLRNTNFDFRYKLWMKVSTILHLHNSVFIYYYIIFCGNLIGISPMRYNYNVVNMYHKDKSIIYKEYLQMCFKYWL